MDAQPQPSTAVTFITQLPAILGGFAIVIAALVPVLVLFKKKLDETAKAVDGQMAAFKEALIKVGSLETEIASLKASKAGFELGQAKAEGVAAIQAGAIADARALSPLDAKIVNGGKEQPAQADRIEATGADTNTRVQKVETVLGDRIEKVEDKQKELD